MNIAIIIATYGDREWRELALTRAAPSTKGQGQVEVLIGHETNGTVSTSRNGLAERAMGEWLCFLDADDELAPGFISAMRRAIEQGCGDGEAHPSPDGTPPLFTPAVSYVRKGRAAPPKFNDRGFDLSVDNWLVVGTLVHRDLFMQVGGFSDYPHGFEDWSLWAKCWKAGAEIVKVKQAVYRAHVNPRSEHRLRWRDRKWQVEMHNKVRAELFPELV